MAHKFKAGDYVKYGAPNGSTGKVDHVIEDRIYLTWTYGRDVSGDPILSSNFGSCRPTELVLITEKEYLKVHNNPAWPEDKKKKPKKERTCPYAGCASPYKNRPPCALCYE